MLPDAEAQYFTWNALMLSANALGPASGVCGLAVRLLRACLHPVPKQTRGLQAYYSGLKVRGRPALSASTMILASLRGGQLVASHVSLR